LSIPSRAQAIDRHPLPGPSARHKTQNLDRLFDSLKIAPTAKVA